MKEIPIEIDGAEVLSFCIFDENVKKFENPGCRVSNTQNIKGMAICQYQNDSEFYLFFCDENWKTLNDALHDNFEEASKMAESIYQGLEKLWSNPN